MFLPLAKAMHLRRDVCLWHIADKKAPIWVLKYSSPKTARIWLNYIFPKTAEFWYHLTPQVQVSCGGPVTFLGKFLRRGENFIIKYKSQNGENLMRLWFSRRVLKNPSVRVAQLRFWNHVIACDNAHSFACVRLFPASTQYPAGSPLTDFRVLQKRRKGADCRRFA